MNLIIELVGIACMGVLWVVSEPTILIRKWLYGNTDNFFTRLLECAMCSSLWLGLALTWNIYHAAIISILAELIYKKINNYL